MIGFAISEDGNDMFYVFANESYPFLYEEILMWVLENWKGREGRLHTVVNENQEKEMLILDKYHFVSGGICEITRVFDCRKFWDIAVNLRPGFSFYNMKDHYDLIGQIRMKINAFQNRDEVTSLDLLKHEYVKESPIYKPEFDLSIINEQGLHVAGCEAFIDYANGVAEIERVCTRSDYRRQGLATTILIECMRRLAAHGINTAYITGMSEGPIRLYGGLGHVKEVKKLDLQLSK